MNEGRSAFATLVVVAVAVALALVACAEAPPVGTPTIVGDRDRLHQQAEAALARWADAVGAVDKTAPVFIGELTGQVGDWEEAVGENNKSALMAGHVRAAVRLPAERPAAGEIRWPDGLTRTVELVSADQALRDVASAAGSGCPECAPLQVTAARLTTGPVQTSRGPATAPLWEFAVDGTKVTVTRVAVAKSVAVVPPPWNSDDAPQGLSIDSASGAAVSRELTVNFVGAPDHADKQCGVDYKGEAVESELAIVVIIIEHRNPLPGLCRAIGAFRNAIVPLAAPLGERAVLEIKQGLPVPVLAP